MRARSRLCRFRANRQYRSVRKESSDPGSLVGSAAPTRHRARNTAGPEVRSRRRPLVWRDEAVGLARLDAPTAHRLGGLLQRLGEVGEERPELEQEPLLTVEVLEPAAQLLATDMKAREHVRDAWMHGKPLLFLGEARQVWDAAGVPFEVEEDPGWLASAQADDAALEAFADAIASPRNFDREVLAQPI